MEPPTQEHQDLQQDQTAVAAANPSAALPLFSAEERNELLRIEVTKSQLLRLAMKGLNATEAAKVLDLHPSTVRGYYREPAFRTAVLKKVEGVFEDIDVAYLNKRKSLHEMLEEQAYRSCQDLIAMLDDEETPLHPSLKVKIHQDFMNRVEDSKQLTGVMKVEPKDLQHAARVAQEMDGVIEMKKRA